MDFIDKIKDEIVSIIDDKFDVKVDADSLLINETRKEFDGDYTLVVFPLVKAIGKNPQEIADTIGVDLVDQVEFIASYNVIKGFLNLSFSHAFWLDKLEKITQEQEIGSFEKMDKTLLIEFSSPNTNKPLHLGHIRNILLGWASSKIHEKLGKQVIKTQIVNDRGIAISKSMLAWKKYGNGDTPTSTHTKSDHFVGQYYVKFEQEFKKEYDDWQQTEEGATVFADKAKKSQKEKEFFKGYKNDYFNKFSPLGAEAKEMLILWEAQDEDIINLWKQMNHWVYDGFDQTYSDLGVDFDSKYYESDTYKLGKDIIDDGLIKGVFYKKDDGSVWIDLEKEGLDQKLVLRSDGTSVYMTQDLGTARERHEGTGADGMVYVVADEQDYHFKALFAILGKLEESYADDLFHLSYGMVDLPSGRMKSREGKVVDADDLIDEVIKVAQQNTDERGELADVDAEQRTDTYRKIGLAALKFFILKVNPKKRMVFNPEESVDMQGTTGPYIQYAYVRIRSITRKAETMELGEDGGTYVELHDAELAIIKQLFGYRKAIILAGENYDPSIIANYAYELAKASHKFIHDVRILNAETNDAKIFRLNLCNQIARTLKDAFDLLGIEMPEKM